LIDVFLPSSHFRDAQSTRVQAPPAAVFAAVRAVTPAELEGLVPFAISLRAPRFEITPREKALMRLPMIEAMRAENFVVLGERKGEEIVMGAIGQFWADRSIALRDANAFRSFRDPRYARIAVNVRVTADGKGGSVVTTETRALCPDLASRKKLGRYWQLWTPGGWVVRNQWFGAVKRRAESSKKR